MAFMAPDHLVEAPCAGRICVPPTPAGRTKRRSISLADGASRVAGVGDAAGALLQEDAGELDLVFDVGLDDAELDLAVFAMRRWPW
jgi:hypothetical protein